MTSLMSDHLKPLQRSINGWYVLVAALITLITFVC